MKKPWDENWLTFSRKSRRGAFVFLFLFMIISIIPRLSQLSHAPTIKITREKISEIEKSSSLKIQQNDTLGTKKAVLPTTSFDPNKYRQEDWEQLGFSQKQAKAIINYKKSIGSFASVEDFEKIYVVADSMYQKLSPLMVFPKQVSENRSKDKVASEANPNPKNELTPKEQISFPIDLNRADEISLKAINGVGAYYAKLIVDYRDALGGFIDEQQFQEIKKLPQELQDSLVKYCSIDPKVIRRINLNNDQELQDLHHHPYINKSVAHSIKILKQQNGNFNTAEELLQSPYIDLNLFYLIRPYISVEDNK